MIQEKPRNNRDPGLARVVTEEFRNDTVIVAFWSSVFVSSQQKPGALSLVFMSSTESKKLEIIYSLSKEVIGDNKLERAFDLLFEEVIRAQQLQTKSITND